MLEQVVHTVTKAKSYSFRDNQTKERARKHHHFYAMQSFLNFFTFNFISRIFWGGY